MSCSIILHEITVQLFIIIHLIEKWTECELCIFLWIDCSLKENGASQFLSAVVRSECRMKSPPFHLSTPTSISQCKYSTHMTFCWPHLDLADSRYYIIYLTVGLSELSENCILPWKYKTSKLNIFIWAIFIWLAALAQMVACVPLVQQVHVRSPAG